VKRFLQCTLVVIALVLLMAGGVYVWFTHRPQPEPIAAQEIFQGITYTRDVRQEPRPLVIHVAQIDLDAPGLQFFARPADPVDGYLYAAQTASDFLEEYDLQLVINTDFFLPWRDHGPWDYYPHAGDGINVRGLTISRGEALTEGYTPTPHTMFISAENEVWFEGTSTNAWNAVSGHYLLLRAGQFVAHDSSDTYITRMHPRTGAALTQDGRTLMLFVVDGRQKNYSEGVTLPEFADIMLEYGAYDAMNFDGGGSSVMVIAGANGQPDALSTPIHNHIPGRQRPLGGMLGIYALSVE
jgi:hypothetical protein